MKKTAQVAAEAVSKNMSEATPVVSTSIKTTTSGSNIKNPSDINKTSGISSDNKNQPGLDTGSEKAQANSNAYASHVKKVGGNEIDSTAKKVEELSANKEKNIFDTYVDQGILEFNNQHQLKLTPEAREIYNYQVKPKAQPKSATNTLEINIESNNTSNISVSTETENIAGILPVSDETELLSPVQSHIVVGTIDRNNDNFANMSQYYTSNKGNTGIANCNTTTFISSTKEFSGDNGAQFTAAIVPPIKVDLRDIQVHEKATAYSNQPEIKEKLKELDAISNRFEAVPYNKDGYTLEHLERIAELMPHYYPNNNHSSNNTEISEVILTETSNNIISKEKENDEVSFANDVD